MPKLIAVIGFLVMSAGLDLLWQSRWDIRYWLEALAKVFRAMLEREKPPQIFPPKESFCLTGKLSSQAYIPFYKLPGLLPS